MRIRIAVLLIALSASCAQQTSLLRLAPRSLPKLAGGQDSPIGARAVGDEIKQPARPVVEVSEFSAVPDAQVSETEVFSFLEQQLAAKDRAKLIAVGPGSSLLERLRYCLCRIQLGQTAKVMPELERLTRDHPKNPAPWRTLGIGYRQLNKSDQEIYAYQQVYKLDGPGHEVCPSVIRVLGDSMLASPSHQDSGIAFLREELGKGVEFAWAGRRLADVFSLQERHVEGLFCLDAALGRDPDSAILRYRKGVMLFDMYRLVAAKKLLSPLVEHELVGVYAKEHLLRCHLLSREMEMARKLSRELLAIENVGAQRKILYQNLAEQVTRGELGVVDCYSVLRGHKSIKVRIGVLGMLASRGKTIGVASRALQIAANSTEPMLRIEAIRLLASSSGQPLKDMEFGFLDMDAKVRAMAATVSPALVKQTPALKAALTKMVLNAMETEQDAYAFRSMHEAMRAITGTLMEIPFGAAKDPEQRNKLAKAWRDLQ